jgi:hypothetical protein
MLIVLSATLGLLIVVFPLVGGSAIADTIGFNNYVSSTNNDLTNNFAQTGTVITQTPYVQSPTGGITGGSVLGYSGSEYRATAVYNKRSLISQTQGQVWLCQWTYIITGGSAPSHLGPMRYDHSASEY